MSQQDADANADADGCCKNDDCCNPNEPCCKDGCCDEDCCNRTCCRGRVNCSLEAGFSAAFAFMSWGVTIYACNSCDYIRIRGHQYYETGGSPPTTNASAIVTGLKRGILYGELVPGTACQSWLAIDREDDRLIDIDPPWYASIAFSFAATGFGFAALVQVLFLSCAPRISQRYVARCSSALSVVTSICLGLTLLYLAGNAVSDVHFPDEGVDFATWSMDVSAYCAVAGTGGWLITAFILCFQEDPDERDAKKTVMEAAEEGSEHAGSVPRAQAWGGEEDEVGESAGGGGGAAAAAEKLEEDGRGGDSGKRAEAAVVPAAAEQTFDRDEVWEDAVYASGNLPREDGRAESQFSNEEGSSDEESGRRYSSSSSSAAAGMGDFVDG